MSNFRGVRSGSVLLDSRSLLVGGNAVRKSPICEALDLALGLERLYRRPVIDEYDFHEARYRADEAGPEPLPEIRIEVVLTGLSPEARRRFAGHLRPWSAETNDFAPPAPDDATELVSGEGCPALGVLGRFNPDEDDFEGNTFFASPQRPEGDYNPADLGGGLAPFRRDDKRYCGFLYLRPNRTGNRALSFRPRVADRHDRPAGVGQGRLAMDQRAGRARQHRPGRDHPRVRGDPQPAAGPGAAVPVGARGRHGGRRAPVGPDPRAPARRPAPVHRYPAGAIRSPVQPPIHRPATP